MDFCFDIAAYILTAVVLFSMGCVTYWCWNDDDSKVIEHD